MEMAPNGSDPICNTKNRVSPAKHWNFTFNNYTNVDIEVLLSFLKEKTSKYIFQEEIAPSTGTPHLQGYCCFIDKIRPLECTPNNKISWRKANNPEGAFRYCMKSESRKTDGKRWTNVKIPVERRPLRVIENLYPWQKEIEDICMTEPDDRTIHWYWEPDGKIGKTKLCKYLTEKHGAYHFDGCKKDILNMALTYYKEVKDKPLYDIFLFNYSRSVEDYISYDSLEKLKDAYFSSGKYEGGMVNENPPHIFVFANFAPCISKLSVDRWKIVCLTDQLIR